MTDPQNSVDASPAPPPPQHPPLPLALLQLPRGQRRKHIKGN